MDYKEKLEEAKRLYELANADQKYVLESLFPELAESEDEEVRKEIITFISTTPKQRNRHPKWLAWLEKQGEVESDNDDIEVEEKGIREAFNKIEDEKQCKQKPQRMISAEAKEAMYAKPAWSEEDNAFLDEIICKVKHDLILNKYEKDWLKSLKERYTWKPSDEQMATLKYACGGNYVDLGVLDSLYNDLKKLKGE